MGISASNIHVGYIHSTKGYVSHVSVEDANVYEKLNPGTAFIFLDGDKRVKYLSIDEVNNINVNDLLRKDPCDTRQKPCGPPTFNFFGGGGVGAAANPVIDKKGQIIAGDIIDGGVGYKTPPQVQVIDPCKNGKGALLETEIEDGVVIRIIFRDTGFGYLPPQPASPQSSAHTGRGWEAKAVCDQAQRDSTPNGHSHKHPTDRRIT